MHHCSICKAAGRLGTGHTRTSCPFEKVCLAQKKSQHKKNLRIYLSTKRISHNISAQKEFAHVSQHKKNLRIYLSTKRISHNISAQKEFAHVSQHKKNLRIYLSTKRIREHISAQQAFARAPQHVSKSSFLPQRRQTYLTGA